MTNDFIPGPNLPKVPPLPKADPKAPGAQPRNPGSESWDKNPPQPGNFNPNVRLDTSNATSSGPPRDLVEHPLTVDDQGGVHWPKGKPGADGGAGGAGGSAGGGGDGGGSDAGDDSHYAVGHQIGRVLGQQLSNQIAAQLAAEIERLFQ